MTLSAIDLTAFAPRRATLDEVHGRSLWADARDLFARTALGTRVSLFVGVIGATGVPGFTFILRHFVPNLLGISPPTPPFWCPR